MKKFIAVLISLPALVAAAPQGAAWSLLPSSTRDASLAGGMASLAHGVEGFSLDPSALSMAKGTQAYLSHSQWHQDVKIEHAALAAPAGSLGGFALGVDWADFGPVTRYSAAPGGGWKSDGELRPSAGSLTLGWGNALGGGFSAGLAGKAWRQSLDGENDNAASASASLRYRAEKWSAVASARDLGGSLGGSALPAQLRAGVSAEPSSWFSLGAEYSRFNSDGSSDLQAGAVLRHDSGLALRGGVALQGEQRAAMSTLGASFQVGSLGLDLAGVFQAGFSPTLHVGLTWAAR